MYLHLGKGTLIPKRDILGIFDLDITSQSHITRKFLTMAEKSGQVVNAAEDIPKTFVVCCERGETRVYLSQMAVSTLQKRMETPVTESIDYMEAKHG